MLNYESYKSSLFSLIFWMNEELLRQSATSILVPLLWLGPKQIILFMINFFTDYYRLCS